MKQFLSPDRIFDGQAIVEDHIIVLEEGVVTDIFPKKKLPDGIQVKQVKGLLCSGLIDLQVNGGGGILFNDHPNEHGLNTIVDAHNKLGTAYLLPTIITDNLFVMKQAADTVASAIAKGNRHILGIHFEGPHISNPKKGVHPSEHIRALTAAEKALYSRQDIGVKLITLAPESVNEADIEFLIKQNCIVSIGHSNASYQECEKVLKAGAKGFTHLYNAMSPMTGREPGAVGSALNNEDSYAGIILDGHHVDYTMAKMAWKLKNSRISQKGKLFLVSDSMSSTGSDQKHFSLFDQKVSVLDGKLTNEQGTLAGAHLSLLEAAQNTHKHLDVGIAESLKMASSYPAQFIFPKLGPNKVGALTKGEHAFLIVLDSELNLIQTLNF